MTLKPFLLLNMSDVHLSRDLITESKVFRWHTRRRNFSRSPHHQQILAWRHAPSKTKTQRQAGGVGGWWLSMSTSPPQTSRGIEVGSRASPTTKPSPRQGNLVASLSRGTHQLNEVEVGPTASTHDAVSSASPFSRARPDSFFFARRKTTRSVQPMEDYRLSWLASVRK